MNELAGIRWGSAVAAYQVEGAVRGGGRVESIWDTFTARPGATTRGDTAELACRTYEDPTKMIEAIAWLGLDTFRLSISWPRIVLGPGGQVNDEGLAYYRRVLKSLRVIGVRPVVTLYHWDLPQWLQERGGWSALATAAEFVSFVRVAVEHLGDLVDDWITINEPFCAAFHGHLSGLHAPGTTDEATALRAAFVQMHAHGRAVRVLRELAPASRVGLAINLSDLAPASDRLDDLAALARADLVENRLFLDTLVRGRVPDDAEDYFGAGTLTAALEGIDVAEVAQPIDFIGVNYYEHNVVRAHDPGTDPVVRGIDKLPVPEPRSANGVAVHPEGLERVLLRVAERVPDVPIWITENGIGLWDYVGPDGTCRDVERVDYINAHLQAMAAAIARGARVEAYYFWSLMDNFEWAHGYQLRYGLFYTDYPTGRLLPKLSAAHYREVVAAARVLGGGRVRPSWWQGAPEPTSVPGVR
jgi:beta-glucosidase